MRCALLPRRAFGTCVYCLKRLLRQRPRSWIRQGAMPAAAAAVAPPIWRLCVEKRLGFSPTARMHSLIEAAKEPQVRYLPFAKWSRARQGSR